MECGGALTVLRRDSKDSLKLCAGCDPVSRAALLTEAVEPMLAGEGETGNAALSDTRNA